MIVPEWFILLVSVVVAFLLGVSVGMVWLACGLAEEEHRRLGDE